MELSIIFVNWNSVDYLRECLTSIYAYTQGFAYEIIVVDNASPQGGVDALQEEFPEIVLIKSEDNLGFAGANNVGFRASKGNCVLFLNPDTKLVNSAINLMLQSLQSLPGAGLLGCKLLNADGSVQTSSIMKFPGILNQVFQLEGFRLRWPSFPLWDIGPLFSNNPAPVKVEVVTGACMMMRREVFEQVGMFSEEYFMYAEDVDLCWKIQRAGFSNYYAGEGNIIHYGGVSSPRAWQTVAKTRAEQRLVENFRGRFYGAMFRAALAMNAAGRLGIAAAVTFFRKTGKGKEDAKAARTKYLAILKTLVTPGGTDLRPPVPQGKPSVPVAKPEEVAH